MAKIIMHIDLNAFFASAEILRHPELASLPIAVGGSSRRGVVSTASYEARKYGVRSAMPIYLAKKICPSLIILPGDYKYYQELSNKFFSIIKNEYTPIIEMASIDECYADMTSTLQNVENPTQFIKDMQENLYKKTGLGCSIGVSTTKFLAKMASDIKKPMGITIIRKKDVSRILYPLPIGDLYGVGKKSVPKLMAKGIKTIGDFASSEDESVKKSMGKMYDALIEALKGNSSSEVITEAYDPKSVSSSVTFLFDTNSYEEIVNAIKEQAQDVGRQLLKRKMVGSTIHITLRDADFKTITRSRTIKEPIKNEEDVYMNAMILFDEYWKGNELRLVGVGVSSLCKEEAFFLQMSLFDYEKNKEECATRLLVNNLNRKAKKDLFITGKELKKKQEAKKDGIK